MSQWSEPTSQSSGVTIGTRLAALPGGLEWWLLALAALAMVLAFIDGQQSRVQLTFEARSATPGSLQIFYAADGVYSEMRAYVWPLDGGVAEAVSVRLPTKDVRSLRLDPAPGMGDIQLCDIQIRLSDSRSLPVATSRFGAFGDAQVRAAGNCVVLSAPTSAPDPQVAVDLAPLVPELVREQRAGSGAATAWAVFGAACFIAFVLMLRVESRKLVVEAGIARIGHSLPWIYLGAALIIGSLLALVTPPGAVPDEPAHIVKVVLVENGHWVGAEDARTTNPSLGSLLGPFAVDFLNPGRRFSVDTLLAHASTPLSCSPSREKFPKSAANYSPTLYMPAAFVLNVACRGGATVGSFIYGSRLANLLVAVLMTFIGIRAAGSLRWPLFVVALFPMTLFELASMTADSLALGMSFCIVGIQCGLAAGNLRPGRGVHAALLALGLALAFSKPGYAWICVGFLFSFAAYRERPLRFWASALLLVLFPWIVHALWILYTAGGAVPRAGVDPAGNLAAVFAQPGETFGLWTRTFQEPNREFLWSSLVGRLGWLDVVLHPSSYTLAGAAAAASLVMRDRPSLIAGTWVRPAAAIFAMGAAMLSVIPMYLFWTPPSALLIEGLQGRYFIPPIVFAMCWMGFRGPLQLRALCVPFLFASLLVVHIDGIYSLVYRYYG